MNDTVETIGAEIASNMPMPNEEVIMSELSKQQEIEKKYQPLVDKNGDGFNPDLHETNRSGEPILTVGGKLRLKRGKGSPSVNTSNSTVNSLNSQEQPYSILGYQSAQCLVACCTMLGGEDFKPMMDEKLGVNELSTLSGAFGEFYKAKDISDIPPGVALVLAVGTYMVPRLMMDRQRSKLSVFYDSIKQRFFPSSEEV